MQKEKIGLDEWFELVGKAILCHLLISHNPSNFSLKNDFFLL